MFGNLTPGKTCCFQIISAFLSGAHQHLPKEGGGENDGANIAKEECANLAIFIKYPREGGGASPPLSVRLC